MRAAAAALARKDVRMPAPPHETVSAYRHLLLERIAETEQLAAALLDLTGYPNAAAAVAALLEQRDALTVMRRDIALARELARAVHDATLRGGERRD
jgi:hypothetical protein